MLPNNFIELLTIKHAGHSNWYFGFNYYPTGPKCNPALYDFATKMTKELDPSATRFCNFTHHGKIRYLCNYNHGMDITPFEGVAYMDIPNYIKEIENE